MTKIIINDRFTVYVGIELLEVSKRRVKAKMKITDYHLNGVIIAHGGAVFSLADLLFFLFSAMLKLLSM